jgi:predicted amidohydrolase
MAHSFISRRQFIRWLTAGCLSGIASAHAKVETAGSSSDTSPVKLRAAAIQITPKLGDAAANLEQVEKLAREALGKGANWIALPEMFTSAAAFHPDMLGAIQPADGAPLQLMQRLAREGNAVIGGSFLAGDNDNVFNRFYLVFPDGSVQLHNKDFPTYWENCYYTKGNDDGVLTTPVGPVGSALCWEFIRSQTARRLLGKVRLIMGGSCWWTLPDDAPADSPRRADNLRMCRQAPVRMARLLGVPVVHGAHVGEFKGFFSPELADVAYNSTYLGEAMIVDAQGKVLARRTGSEGE